MLSIARFSVAMRLGAGLLLDDLQRVVDDLLGDASACRGA